MSKDHIPNFNLFFCEEIANINNPCYFLHVSFREIKFGMVLKISEKSIKI
jgi:hypothetical protein